MYNFRAISPPTTARGALTMLVTFSKILNNDEMRSLYNVLSPALLNMTEQLSKKPFGVIFYTKAV